MVSFRHLERTNKLFAAFMQQPRYEASGKPAQSLDSYLLQPIQRVGSHKSRVLSLLFVIFVTFNLQCTYVCAASFSRWRGTS